MWAILLVVSILLSLWVYRGAFKRAWYLVLLRALSIFLLLLVALSPIFHREKVVPTEVDVLIDKSGSMGYPDKANFLKATLKDLKNLSYSGISLSFFSFDTSFNRGINLNFGGKTNIGLAIDSAKSRFIVLLSDGLNNRGSFPSVKGKKVLAFPPPTSKALIKEFSFKPVIVEGISDTIRVTSAVTGKIEIYEGNKAIYSGKVVKNKPAEITLNLKTPGFHPLQMKINGKIARKFTVRVIKRGKRVLIYASHPDVNIRFLRMYIEYAGNISPDYVVKTKKGIREYRPDTVIDLKSFEPSGYDFYIMIDPSIDMIKPLEHGGKGLVIFTRTPAVLPELLGGQYLPSKMTGELYPHWRDTILAPVSYIWVLNRYPPESETPVFIKVANRNVPLLFLTGRLAFLMSGDFFKEALFDFKTFSRILDLVFSRLIPEGSFFVEIPSRQFEKGEKIPVTAYAFDKFGNAVDTLFPFVKIGNQKYPMNYVGNGKYVASIAAKDTGRVKASVVFKGPGGFVKEERITLRIRSLSEEKPTPEVDLAFLRSIGEVVTSKKALHQFLKSIKPTTVREKINLRNYLALILLAFALLGVEWFLRRSNGVV